MSAQFKLQQAIYSTLTNDVALMAKVTGVFDAVPTDQGYPYISFGGVNRSPLDTFLVKGGNVLIDLHIHSKYQGFKEADEILDLVDGLINRKDLAVDGYSLINLEQELVVSQQESDGVVRQLIARYRAYLVPA